MSEALALSLDGGVRSPADARRFVHEHLAGVPQDVCADALVLVSELVTNVHLHGLTPAGLTLEVAGGVVRIEVFDSGPAIPVVPGQLPRPQGGGGRGLFIVAALATAWGIRTSGGAAGKTVWIELAG